MVAAGNAGCASCWPSLQGFFQAPERSACACCTCFDMWRILISRQSTNSCTSSISKLTIVPGLQVNFHSINITDPGRISFQIPRIEDIPFGEGENPFLKLTDTEKEQVQPVLSNCLLPLLPGGSATMRHGRPRLCAHACWPLLMGAHVATI